MTEIGEFPAADRALFVQLRRVLEQVQAVDPTCRRADLLAVLHTVCHRVELGESVRDDALGPAVGEALADLCSLRDGTLGSDHAVLVRLQALPEDIADILIRSSTADRRARQQAWVQEAEQLAADSVDWDGVRRRLEEIKHLWEKTRNPAGNDELWARFCAARATFDNRHAAHLKTVRRTLDIAEALQAASPAASSSIDDAGDEVSVLLRDAGRRRAFRRGDLLVAEGAPSEDVLLIETGKVKVVLHGPNGADSIVAFYGSGDLVGEMGVMSNRPRSADVIARTPGVAVHVAAPVFRGLLRDHPTLTGYLTDVLSERLHQADLRQGLHKYEVSVRITRQLLSWALASGEPVEGGGLRVQGLTQLEIGQFVTASPKTVDRVIRQLRADTLVETGRRCYILPNPQALAQCLSDPTWRPGNGVSVTLHAAQEHRGDAGVANWSA